VHLSKCKDGLRRRKKEKDPTSKAETLGGKAQCKGKVAEISEEGQKGRTMVIPLGRRGKALESEASLRPWGL